MSGGLIFMILVFAVRVLAMMARDRKPGSGAKPITRARVRAFAWGLLFVVWIVWDLYALAGLLAMGGPHGVPWALANVVPSLLGAWLFFFSWRTLHALARRGRSRLVYWLTHLTMIYATSGETRAAACLLALVALAYRGAVTKEEWIEQSLARDKNALGTGATAWALRWLLGAKLEEAEGRVAEARALRQRARTLLGTVTYGSARGVPRDVMRIAWELLTLDAAGRGQWGAAEAVPEAALTPVTRDLRSWERTRSKPDDEAPPAKAATQVLETLARRAPNDPIPAGHEATWSWARQTFVALLHGKAVGRRQLLNMLAIFDFMFHPEYEHTLLPPEIRGGAGGLGNDEELVASVHDAVADALAQPVARELAPLFAMKMYGPISSRVYQRIEASLFDEMERAFKSIDEHTQRVERREALEEWLEVSYVRSVYRRVGATLGMEAAKAVWPQFVHYFGNFGVKLSETEPRRRPLAHTVFSCLHRDALLFEDREAVRQQSHNMKVTAGLE